LGLFFQFFIAFSPTAVYYAASRWLPFLLRQPFGHLIRSGVLLFPDRVELLLSAARKHPIFFKLMAIGLTIHILRVGLPMR
jgi:hypothetical protein